MNNMTLYYENTLFDMNTYECTGGMEFVSQNASGGEWDYD